MMFILCGALLILAHAFNLESIILEPAFGVFAALYIIFPFPAILFASTISYLFDTLESGQALFGITTIFGFFPYMIVFILKSVPGIPSKASLITHVVFSFIS